MWVGDPNAMMKLMFYIDSKADAAQRHALERIFTGGDRVTAHDLSTWTPGNVIRGPSPTAASRCHQSWPETNAR